MNVRIQQENLIALIPDSFTSLRIQEFRGDLFYKTGNSSFRLAIPLVPIGSIQNYHKKLLYKSRTLLKKALREISPAYVMEIQNPVKVNGVILLNIKMSDEMIPILDRLKDMDTFQESCNFSLPLKGLFLGYSKKETDFEYTKQIYNEKHSITGKKIYKASLILFSLNQNESYEENIYNWSYTNILSIRCLKNH